MVRAMERYRGALGCIAAAAVIAVAAIVVPRLVFDDTADAPPAAVQRLKAQAAHVRTIPSLVSQAVRAEQYGPTPDHVRGRVVARTFFGVRIGWYELSAEGSADWHYNHRNEIAAPAGFLFTEGALLGAAGWLLLTSL